MSGSGRLKVGILGCRGIPNQYGGFEQFAERLTPALVSRHHMEVWVYNSSRHPLKDPVWKGVQRILCRDPEHKIGQAGQFVYDWLCIQDSRRRGFDVILQLGYTSNAIWHWRLPKHAAIITNMDGLEWQRSKYSAAVRRFLRYSEALAAKHSDVLVADSIPIRQHLEETYGRKAAYIPYGAEASGELKATALADHQLAPDGYYLLIARIQSDNHILEIIRGHSASLSKYPLVVVGDTDNRFGRRLKKAHDKQRVIFAGPVFDQEKLHQLRRHCRMYFHGHSSGGTNPSLLEAMGDSALICAHDNPFNRAVLGEDALYFGNESDVSYRILKGVAPGKRKEFVQNNLQKVDADYRWSQVTDAYAKLIREAVQG